MSENAKLTYCDITEKGKKYLNRRIDEWDSKEIIQNKFEESIEWGRRYEEIYAQNKYGSQPQLWKVTMLCIEPISMFLGYFSSYNLPHSIESEV